MRKFEGNGNVVTLDCGDGCTADVNVIEVIEHILKLSEYYHMYIISQ